MKKFLFALFILIVAFSLVACTNERPTPAAQVSIIDSMIDAGLISSADMTGYEGFYVTDHIFYETDFMTVFNLMNNTDEPFVLYIGFGDCPWCTQAINPMYEAAREAGIARILYINRRSETNHFADEENQWRPSDMENIFMRFLEDQIAFVTRGELTRVFVPEVIVWDGNSVLANRQGTFPDAFPAVMEITEEEAEYLRFVYMDMFRLLD